MSSKAKPSRWSELLNTIAKIRGKTRKVKHIYDEIPKSRYNILDKEDKAKYTSLRNGTYILKHLYAAHNQGRQPNEIPHTLNMTAPPNTSALLNKTARNKRVLKMLNRQNSNGSPAALSAYPPARRRPPTSAMMTSTGSPLSPRTTRNSSLNGLLNSYSEVMKSKIREHATTTGTPVQNVLKLLGRLKKETRDKILDYITENPEAPLEEVLTFIQVMGE